MTKKKKITNLMKEIRASTGLALPAAKIAARLIVKNELVSVFGDKGLSVEARHPFHCESCRATHHEYVLVGPKGEYILKNIL